MAKSIGFGSVLTVAASSTAEENNVGQVLSISGPGVSANDVDTTCFDSSSNYRTFAPGLLDPGELSFQVIYDSTSTSHALLTYYLGQRTTVWWQVIQGSSAGTVQEFKGYVKGMNREMPMDDKITCDFTVKVTGLPGYTT